MTGRQSNSSRSGVIVLNGRAAARSVITGVERWAIEMIKRLPVLHPDRYLVISPPPALAHRAGQLWEQVWLPLQAARLRSSLIWSPANIAPLAWQRNVVVVHDAAVLRHPEAYGWAYRTWHARIGVAVARRALRVITDSEFSRRELVDLAGLDPAAVVVIRGGVDQRFSPTVDAERVRNAYALKRPYVLTVASADARKNLSLLGHVADRLAALGLDLVWAGGKLGHIAGEPPIDGVRRLGYVPDDDLPGLYAGAAAFVLPSRYEGFGLTCVEAMASGAPVVAADRAALPETCGGAALLIDPDDPDGTAAAVVSAATDTETGARLRAAGLRRAAQLTWEHAAEETDALLEELQAGSAER